MKLHGYYALNIVMLYICRLYKNNDIVSIRDQRATVLSFKFISQDITELLIYF